MTRGVCSTSFLGGRSDLAATWTELDPTPCSPVRRTALRSRSVEADSHQPSKKSLLLTGSRPLGRDEEERLLPQAVRGSVGARRRITDSYAELAAVFALKIRPRSVPEARAVRLAQEELDRLVRFPSKGPLLVSLVQGIIKKLVP